MFGFSSNAAGLLLILVIFGTMIGCGSETGKELDGANMADANNSSDTDAANIDWDAYIEDRVDVPVFSTRLPVMNRSADVYCEGTGQEIDLRSWVAAADAIVFGTVASINPTRDLGVTMSTPSEILEGAQCQSIHGGFQLILEDIVTVAGVELNTVEVRFGFATADAWIGFPNTYEDVLLWREGSGTIEPGMTIGGALYHVPQFDFYTFESAAFQPIFEVHDDTVLFQQMGQKVCDPLVPPVTQLSGLPLARFINAVSVANDAVVQADGYSSELRRRLGADRPWEAGDHRARRWFPACYPND